MESDEIYTRTEDSLDDAYSYRKWMEAETGEGRHPQIYLAPEGVYRRATKDFWTQEQENPGQGPAVLHYPEVEWFSEALGKMRTTIRLTDRIEAERYFDWQAARAMGVVRKMEAHLKEFEESNDLLWKKVDDGDEAVHALIKEVRYLCTILEEEGIEIPSRDHHVVLDPIIGGDGDYDGDYEIPRRYFRSNRTR